MKNLFFCSTLVLLTLSCNTSKKSVDGYQYPEESMIGLKAGPCYGKCPVFEMTLAGTGKATYVGDHFTEKEGNYEKQFSAEETNRLFDAFSESDFWNFQDEYLANITDLPTNWLTFTHKGKTKKIRCYYDIPEPLVNLIKEMHALAETGSWTKLD